MGTVECHTVKVSNPCAESVIDFVDLVDGARTIAVRAVIEVPAAKQTLARPPRQVVREAAVQRDWSSIRRRALR
jgi:hypothetical protein